MQDTLLPSGYERKNKDGHALFRPEDAHLSPDNGYPTSNREIIKASGESIPQDA